MKTENSTEDRRSPGSRRSSRYVRWGKRLVDLGVALPALAALSPLMLGVAAGVRVFLGTPVLFRQQRPGRDGKLFTLLKFRTMTDATGLDGSLLSDGERLTSFGRLLRRSSIDELPELLNVVRGDMSLVGPRPLLVRYYPYFKDEEMARFSVRPGITGLAQITGRNDLSWDSRIQQDLKYVKDCSLALDLRILLRTAAQVLKRDGIQVDPGAVMLDFDEERRRGGVQARRDGDAGS